MKQHPLISVGQSCGIWISNSLTNGSVVAVRRIGHRGHRIWTHQITTYRVTWTPWCMHPRWTRQTHLFRRILNAARRINNAAVPRTVTRSLVTPVGKCIQADGSHFEQLAWVVNCVTVTVQLTTIFNKHTTRAFPFYFIQFTVNTQSFLTVANRTHVHMTFLAQKYLCN
jgi:hypothetical protein